ncbi:MAG: glycolate oxidase subunit GlcF, partial [Pseudomonadales bacterium]
MRTQLHPDIIATDWGREADRILRSCVHCGFCAATCPTYRLLGDELDSPRGRIYLIKEMLELDTAGPLTQRHLDRCLTCRACETTCPSGVEYGRLLEIGREYLELKVARAPAERLARWLMCHLVPYPRRLTPLMRLGQSLRPLMPRSLKQKVPKRDRPIHFEPIDSTDAQRKVVLLEGCVQRVARGSTNAGARKLLNEHGVEVTTLAEERCCGALALHLGHASEAEEFMVHNVDVLERALDGGAQAIISSASGCGVTLKDYGRLLRGEPGMAERARRVASHIRDLAEYVLELDLELPRVGEGTRVAFQTPCTFQHGQRLANGPEELLGRAGYEIVPVVDAHLCCGSAGAYSLLEPRISGALRERKLEALQKHSPDVIATANIGC